MEEKFIAAWMACRQNAGRIGVRMRPVAEDTALQRLLAAGYRF